MIDLTPLINAAIAVIAAIALRFLVPWLKTKTTENERKDLLKWVDIAVAAAQQLYYQSSGEARKQYVLDFLRDKGFDVSDEAVHNAIEAAVLALHQGLETANGDGE